MKKTLRTTTLSHFILLASPIIALILGSCITIFATYFVHSTSYEKEYIEFQTATKTVIDRSSTSLTAYTGLLYAVRAFITQNDAITSEQFEAYVRELPLSDVYGGLQSIGYSRVYTPAQLTQLPATIPVITTVDRDEYHLVLMSQSVSTSAQSEVGYDLSSDPVKLAAMERARDTGVVVSSQGIDLLNRVNGERHDGFMLFLPVYRNTTAASNVDIRRRSLVGFVYVSVQAHDFFMRALDSKPPEAVNIQVFDSPQAEEENILFEWNNSREQHPKFQLSQIVSALGSEWLVTFSSKTSTTSISHWWFSPFVLGVGLILTYSLYLTTRSQIGARIRAEQSEAELSESKRQLEASEQQLKMLIEGVKDYAIVMLSPRGHILSWNFGAQSMLNFTETEAIGQPYTIFFLEKKRRKNTRTELQQVLEEGKVTFEKNFVQKNGTHIWVSGVLNALYDSRKKLRGFALIARDTTQRMLTESELQRSKALNEAILASLPAHLAVLDRSGNILQSNKSWKLLMKRIHSDNPNLSIYQDNLLDWWRHQITKANSKIDLIVRGIIEVQKGKKKTYTSEVGLDVKGKKSWFLLQAKALQHVEDGVVISLTDITLRKKLEKQKDDFMSIASHELKTPITSAKSYAQVLKRIFYNQKDEKSVSLLDKMDAQLNKVTTLINDLLDITKIEAGMIQFNNESFNFDGLVKEIVELVQLSSPKHTFSVRLDADYMVYGDRERIGQVISNLLTNAVKYSPEAKKVVIATKKGAGWVTCSVKDFGIGIAKDKQERLFEKFYRVNDAYPNTFHGLGLGLYIAQKIATRSGGKIQVESTPGKGSVFTLRLPIFK